MRQTNISYGLEVPIYLNSRSTSYFIGSRCGCAMMKFDIY